ncbi:MAG: acetyl-CoA carboxylase, carboxyltransferase subunit beta [Saprospiraceae bacterium]|nr:acetyl-CoA carboxylase, carboxyltransferase subunit beta [Saprospiraceae bacterium]
MGWFTRLREGIQTATKNKKEVPDGLWFKCPSCKDASTMKEMRDNFYICPKCDFHSRIGSHDYFDLLYDDQEYQLHFEELQSEDFLQWEDLKTYRQRLDAVSEKSPVSEAISVASGKSNGKKLVVAAMDFSYIGGSMGSVVGERIARAIEFCIKKKAPLLIISKSGGARMMESAFSLMQLAKTSALLAKLAKAKVPYLSMLTDPTTGGVTASFAMLGDINFAEPRALIGFAGPRVIKETIKKELPEGFQTSEFLLEHGFLDFIVRRDQLKSRLHDVLHILQR